MPYLTLDLDGKKKVPHAARLAGLTEAEIGWGLMNLWEWAWNTREEEVTVDLVGGLFGGEAQRVARALVTFDFLEDLGGARYRVRGAQRYLRIAEARSRGGHAAKKNLIPGAKQRTKSLGLSRGAAEGQPMESLGSVSALSPNTEHRTPITEIPTVTKRTKTPSWQQLTYAQCQEARGEKFERSGLEFVPDEPIGPAFLNKRLLEIGEQLDCPDGHTMGLRIVELFVRYLGADWPANEEKFRTPYAFKVFLSDKTWPQFLEQPAEVAQ